MQESLIKECEFVLIVENGEAPVLSIGLAFRGTDIYAESVVVYYIKNADCYLNHVH